MSKKESLFSNYFFSSKLPEATEETRSGFNLLWADFVREAIVGIISAMIFTSVGVLIYFLVKYVRFLLSHKGLTRVPWMSQVDKRPEAVNGVTKSRGSGTLVYCKENGTKPHTMSVHDQLSKAKASGARKIRQRQLTSLTGNTTNSESDYFHSAHNASSSICRKPQHAHLNKRHELKYGLDVEPGELVQVACPALDLNHSSPLKIKDSFPSKTSSDFILFSEKCLDAEEATRALLHGDFSAARPNRKACGKERNNSPSVTYHPDLKSQDEPDSGAVVMNRRREKIGKDGWTKKPLEPRPVQLNSSYLIPRLVRSHMNLTGDFVLTPDQLLVSENTPPFRPLSITVRRKRYTPSTNAHFSDRLSRLERKRSPGLEVASAKIEGCTCRKIDSVTAPKRAKNAMHDSRNKEFRGKRGIVLNVDFINSRPSDSCEERARKIANSNMLLKDKFALPCEFVNARVKFRDSKSQKLSPVSGNKWTRGDYLPRQFNRQRLMQGSLGQRSSPKTRKVETLAHGHPNKLHVNDSARPNWPVVQNGLRRRKVMYVKHCGSPTQRAQSRLKKKKVKCNACKIAQLLHQDQRFRTDTEIASANCSSNMNPVPSDISLIEKSLRVGQDARTDGGVCWFSERNHSIRTPSVTGNFRPGNEMLRPGDVDFYTRDSLGVNQQPLSPTRWNVSPLNSSSYDSSVLTMRSFVSYRFNRLFETKARHVAEGTPLYENEKGDRLMSLRDEKMYYFQYDSDNGSCNVDLSASSEEKLQEDDFLSTQVQVDSSVIHPSQRSNIASEKLKRCDSIPLVPVNANPARIQAENIVTSDYPDIMHYHLCSPHGESKTKQVKAGCKKSKIPVPSYRTPNSVQARVQCDGKPPQKPTNKIPTNMQKSFRLEALTVAPQRMTGADVQSRFNQSAVNVGKDKSSQDFNIGIPHVKTEVPSKRHVLYHSNGAKAKMLGKTSHGERLENIIEYTEVKNPQVIESKAMDAKITTRDEDAKIKVKNINRILNYSELHKEDSKMYTEIQRKSIVKDNTLQANVKQQAGYSRNFPNGVGKRLSSNNQFDQVASRIPGDKNSFKELLFKKLSNVSRNETKKENESPKPRAEHGSRTHAKFQMTVNQEASYSCGDTGELSHQQGETKASPLVAEGKRRATRNAREVVDVGHALQGTGDLGQKILKSKVSETRGPIIRPSASSVGSKTDDEREGKHTDIPNYEQDVPFSKLIPNITPLSGNSQVNKLSVTSAMSTLQPSSYRSDCYPITCVTYRDYYSMSDKTSHTLTPVTSCPKWTPQCNKSFPQSKSNTSVSEAPKPSFPRAQSFSEQQRDTAWRDPVPKKAKGRPLQKRPIGKKKPNAFSDTSSIPQKTPILNRRTEGAMTKVQKYRRDQLRSQAHTTPEKPVPITVSDSSSRVIPIAKPEEVPAILDGLKETLLLRRKSFISKSESKKPSRAKKQALKDKPHSHTDSSPDTHKETKKAVKRPRSRISSSGSTSPAKPSVSKKGSPVNSRNSVQEKGQSKSPPRIKERKSPANVPPNQLAKDLRVTDKKRFNSVGRKNVNKFTKQVGNREGNQTKGPYDNLKQSMNVGKADTKRTMGSSSSLKKSPPEQTPTARHLLGDVDALREKYLREMVSKDIYQHLPVDISPTSYRKSVLEHYQWMTSNYPGASSNTGNQHCSNKPSMRQSRQSSIPPEYTTLTPGNVQGRSLVAPSRGSKKTNPLDTIYNYSKGGDKKTPNASGVTMRAVEKDNSKSILEENLAFTAANSMGVRLQEQSQQAEECGYRELHLENSTERCQLAINVPSSIRTDVQKEEKQTNKILPSDDDFPSDANYYDHNEVLDKTLEAFVGDICNESQYYLSKREYFKSKTDTTSEKDLSRNIEGIRVANAESTVNRKASKESKKCPEELKRDDLLLSNSGSWVREACTKTTSGHDLLLNKAPLLTKSSAKPCVNSKYPDLFRAIENIKRSRSDATREATHVETAPYTRPVDANVQLLTEDSPCGAQVKATSAEISPVTPYSQTDNYVHLAQILENSFSRKSNTCLRPEEVSPLKTGGSGGKLCDEKGQFHLELEKQRRNLRRLGLRRSMNQKYVTSALHHDRKKTACVAKYDSHSVLEKNNSAKFRRSELKNNHDKCIMEECTSCSVCHGESVGSAHCVSIINLSTDRMHDVPFVCIINNDDEGVCAFNEEQLDALAMPRENKDRPTFGDSENVMTVQGAAEVGLVRMGDNNERFSRSPGSQYDSVDCRSHENKMGDIGRANMSACAQVSFDWYRPSASANAQRETVLGQEQDDAQAAESRGINETAHSRFRQMCPHKGACAIENLSGCCHFLLNGVVHHGKNDINGKDYFRCETRNKEAHTCPYSRGNRNRILTRRPHIVMLPCLPNPEQEENAGYFNRGDRCSRSADSQSVNSGSCSKLKSARTCCQKLRQHRDTNRLVDGRDNESDVRALYRNLLCTYNQANQEFHDNWLVQNNPHPLCRHATPGRRCPCDRRLAGKGGNEFFSEIPLQWGGESDLDLSDD